MLAFPWKWFIEYTSPTQGHMYGVERYVHSGRTAVQKIDIIDTDFFGRCLILDGKMQSSETDEYIYHESLIHPAMVTHPEPKEVLVIGGGEGAVLREVLKYASVQKIVMLDLDQEVIELSKLYLPQWSNGAFQDPKVELIFTDARQFLEEKQGESWEKWDIVVIDLPEPLDGSPCYLLFTKEFYQLIANYLEKGGIMALQAGEFNPRLFQCHSAIYNTLKLIFKHVDSYGTFIPSYNTRWSFICASQEHSPRRQAAESIDRRLEAEKITDLRFYDGMTHGGIFTLPKDLRVLRSQGKRIIEDDNPLFTY